VDVSHVGTDDQLADILTKPLGRIRFVEMRQRLGTIRVDHDLGGEMLLCSFCNRVNVYQHIVALIGIVCFSFEHMSILVSIESDQERRLHVLWSDRFIGRLPAMAACHACRTGSGNNGAPCSCGSWRGERA